MTDFIINNPITLRGCILYEFTKGKGSCETYKELMKTLGDNSMNYPEFEFWFMRFARGNFDLDYDFSLEPKKRKITDLPVEIFEKVGDSLDFEDRGQLRLVSKDIQFRVDKWNPKVTEFTYYNFNNWSIVQNSKYFSSVFRRSSYMTRYLLSEAVKILKNPKLRLKKLSVNPDAKWMKIEDKLRKSSIKLHVNHLIIWNRNGTIDFRLLAPESLEEVTLRINEKSVETVNEILQSEHYKQLKMLTAETDISPSEFPFESFIGVPRFTIKFDSKKPAILKVAKFIKTLMTCPQLEFCKLKCSSISWEPFKKRFNQKDTLVPDSPNLRRYPIQGSTDFHEINIGKTYLSIARKS
ncbi:hypothetical protein CRE_25937 [Caenorhabditis remanei]|uniref:F-box domain-containing protein n=1 Tax=Caenorhabditis remanei TaxID=31234 RepID=E3NK11_CAERE|nr:hypothetical protein CRE_25937 [Caenorhabditis remanei]